MHRISELQRRIILHLSTRPARTTPLARALGVHPQSVSRSLGQLQDAGIVYAPGLTKYLTVHGQTVCQEILHNTEREALKVERRIGQPRFSGRSRITKASGTSAD